MTANPPRDLGERTFRFACDIVRFCRKLSAEPGVVRQIAWQLADAGTSVAANYEEAKGSYSRREFASKNSIVLKEARESRMWLRLVLECGLASEHEARPLYDEVNQLVGIFIATDFYGGAGKFRRQRADGTMDPEKREQHQRDSKRIPAIIGAHVHQLFVMTFRPLEDFLIEQGCHRTVSLM
jgi:four helix bundle protein